MGSKFTLRSEYQDELVGASCAVGDQGHALIITDELQRGNGAIITDEAPIADTLRQMFGAHGPLFDEKDSSAKASVQLQHLPREAAKAAKPKQQASAGEDVPDGPDADSGYDGLKVDELREELSARGLPTDGKKEELVAALEADDAEGA